jgi:ribose 1,5-bisphosphokinase PhnN
VKIIKHFILNMNSIFSNLKASADSQFRVSGVNQTVRQGILTSKFQMRKKKSSTQVMETLSKRFIDSTLMQQGMIVNLTNSTNLTHVTKRLADGNVVQQADMLSNVEQHGQIINIINNVNGEHSAASFQNTGKKSGKYFYCLFIF